MSINKKVIINTKEFFTHCFCFQCFFVLLIMVVVGEGYLRVPYIPQVSSQARHITNSDMLTRLVIMRCEYLCIMKSILQPYPHGRLPLKVKIERYRNFFFTCCFSVVIVGYEQLFTKGQGSFSNFVFNIKQMQANYLTSFPLEIIGKLCSMLTIKTPERRQWRCFDDFKGNRS